MCHHLNQVHLHSVAVFNQAHLLSHLNNHSNQEILMQPKEAVCHNLVVNLPDKVKIPLIIRWVINQAWHSSSIIIKIKHNNKIWTSIKQVDKCHKQVFNHNLQLHPLFKILLHLWMEIINNKDGWCHNKCRNNLKWTSSSQLVASPSIPLNNLTCGTTKVIKGNIIKDLTIQIWISILIRTNKCIKDTIPTTRWWIIIKECLNLKWDTIQIKEEDTNLIIIIEDKICKTIIMIHKGNKTKWDNQINPTIHEVVVNTDQNRRHIKRKSTNLNLVMIIISNHSMVLKSKLKTHLKQS